MIADCAYLHALKRVFKIWNHLFLSGYLDEYRLFLEAIARVCCCCVLDLQLDLKLALKYNQGAGLRQLEHLIYDDDR